MRLAHAVKVALRLLGASWDPARLGFGAVALAQTLTLDDPFATGSFAVATLVLDRLTTVGFLVLLFRCGGDGHDAVVACGCGALDRRSETAVGCASESQKSSWRSTAMLLLLWGDVLCGWCFLWSVGQKLCGKFLVLVERDLQNRSCRETDFDSAEMYANSRSCTL